MPAAEVDLVLRLRFNPETGGAEHGLDTGAIRHPPVCFIVGIAVFDEMHFRITGIVERRGCIEVVILLD